MGLPRPLYVGAETAPRWLYSARAPIPPKRPYGLTRPVVPPDGSFRFGEIRDDNGNAVSPVRSLTAKSRKTPHNYGLRRCRASIAGQAKTFPQDNPVTSR